MMLSDLRYRLRAIFRRSAMEHELASELEFHRERLVSKLMATGLTRAEAERQARLAMGGAEQVTEACREARGVALVESTAQDLRYALRQLRKSPVFAIVVVASLGLGIGANTAIFSLIDAVLLRSLPVAAPHELFIVAPTQADGTTRGVDYVEYRSLAAATRVFNGIAVYGTARLSVSVDGSVEPTAQGQLVSGSYFPMLGTAAAAGRLIGPDDDLRPNGHPVAVLGHGYWRRRFAQDPSSAGLFVRTQHAIDAFDGGFARDSVLVMRIEPPGSDQRGTAGTSERLDRTYRDLLDRVATIAGVRSASLAHYAPTAAVGYAEPMRLPSGETSVDRMMVYPGYFATMGLPIRSGRDLEARDLDQSAPQVGLVNEAFVRELMNGESPLGRQFPDDRSGRPRAIVGVVADSRYASPRGRTPPLVYQPFLQTHTGRGQMTLHARVDAAEPGVAARIREEVHRIDAQMPLLAMYTLAEQVASSLSRERLLATLSGLFGALALLLAAIGLYGLMAFAVVQRSGEIGVRVALGANRTAVLGMVLRDALGLVAVGLAIGVPAALGAGRLASHHVSSLLFSVTADDPVTLAGAAAVLVVVAAAAAYFPAARAAGIDPVEALRAE